ncbi:TPA: hypothetical protein ACWLUJ_005771 [Pseudomonas aeruginosa]|nr:hypothetical protein [Pseudomonas aeruginosa]EIU2864580.1 hypothetical protein [Pseudomonas aeruginosa]HEJ2342254.1 hypothetical protein [Pseudomonas aeruginosa]HEK3716916.1 hypothetical protein [Pseudomonas aeruginosa]
MSVYHRFYVKTNSPRQVEQVIVSALGGSAWLESDDRGGFLRPVLILREDQQCIQPARDICRNLVYLESQPEQPKWWWRRALEQLWKRFAHAAPSADTDSQVPKWYWFPAMIRVQSAEAAQIALALYKSPLVEAVAEDNEVSGNEDDAVATVIDSDHYLLDPLANGGQHPSS